MSVKVKKLFWRSLIIPGILGIMAGTNQLMDLLVALRDKAPAEDALWLLVDVVLFAALGIGLLWLSTKRAEALDKAQPPAAEPPARQIERRA